MSAIASQPLRRSPRFVTTPQKVPVRSAPTAPKKARAPKQPSAAAAAKAEARAERWAQIFADQEAAECLCNERIKTAVADLAQLELLDRKDEFRGTLTYLFETLFGSDDFGSLGEHHAYTDVIFRLLQRIHSGEVEHASSELFDRGFDKICFFLWEVGFPVPNEFFRTPLCCRK